MTANGAKRTRCGIPASSKRSSIGVSKEFEAVAVVGEGVEKQRRMVLQFGVLPHEAPFADVADVGLDLVRRAFQRRKNLAQVAQKR